MNQLIYPYTDDNGIPPTLGKLSEEYKQKGIKALQYAINHTKELIEKQKLSGSKDFNLRNYQPKHE